MITSVPFLVVAGVNQALPLAGARYSMALLWGMSAAALVVTPTVGRALARRAGLRP